jgi:hypothetical protein
MANIRIKDLSTTAAVTASDDFIAVDGATNGTRKLNAYSPTFGGNLTSGLANVTVAGASSAYTTYSANSVGSVFIGQSGGADQLATGSASGDAVFRSVQKIFLSTGGATPALTLDTSGNQTTRGNLTVSGTGGSTFNAASVASPSSAYQANQAFRIISTTTAEVQQAFLSGGTYGYYIQVGGASTYPLLLQPSGSSVLLGTTTDSGNGKLQLATHTTSAGGIGLGTSLSVYSDSANRFCVVGGTTTRFRLFSTSGNAAELGFDNSELYAQSTTQIRFITNNTTALTLDSSQRCILAGALRLNNAYTAGAPTATGYVTIQDSAGNTYKVLVGT